jgi:pimeloyl-ACP methyl ester carboxylesterase
MIDEETVVEPVAAPPQQGTVAATDGVEIAYTTRVSGSPALVFIHGWMCNQTFWSEQVDVFSPSHTVVTIDLPGHTGLSGTDRQGWPLMAYGGDVQSVVEHLDLAEVILVGHSMGGPVALEAARLMPDRVIGVIGVDTLQDAEFEYQPGQAEAFLGPFRSDFPGACSRFVTAMFADGADPALVEGVESQMCSGSPEIGLALMEQYSEYDLGAALAAVDIPVSCVNASMWPTNIEGNRTYCDDFDAVIVEGPGHFLMMESPEIFNAHLGLVVAEISEAI